MVRVERSSESVERMTLPEKCSIRRLHADVRRLTVAHAGGQRLGYWNPQPQYVDLRKFHHWHRAHIGSARLNKRSRVSVPPSYDPIERSRYSRILRERSIVLLVSLRNLQLLPGGR